MESSKFIDLENIALICKEQMGLDPLFVVIDPLTGIVDYTGNIKFYGDDKVVRINIEKIPVKFGTLIGNFETAWTNIVDLENSPKTIIGDFDISYSENLKSLYGSPETIHGNFYCQSDKLSTLKYMPKYIDKDFLCSLPNLDIMEYRWVLYSHIDGNFMSDNENVNKIINKYKNDKSNITTGINELKQIS